MKYDDDEPCSWLIEDGFLLQCLHNSCFLLQEIFYSDEGQVIFGEGLLTSRIFSQLSDMTSRNLVQFRALMALPYKTHKCQDTVANNSFISTIFF